MNNIAFLPILYLLSLVCSIALLIIYKRLLKDNIDNNGLMIFISIIIVEIGYFVIPLCRNTEVAIFANRLSYCGSIMLLISMRLVVNKFCNVDNNKIINTIINIISLLVFLIVFTGGSSITIFYKKVDIEIINGVTYLIKEYGPLHKVYGFYVLVMVALMLITVVSSIYKKRVFSSVNPAILFLLVSENLIVWYIEKVVGLQMELLAFSYITTETIFLMIFKNNDDYINLNLSNTNKTIKTVEQVVTNWKEQYKLTERELEIVHYLIENTARSDIAKILCISEHTVKKHTTHIYEKLNIVSRNDLLYKLNEELTH